MTPVDVRERLGSPAMAMPPARTPLHRAKEEGEAMVDKANDSGEKQEVRRRRLGRLRRAHAGRVRQTEAAARRDAWDKRRRKRRLAWVFFALGAVVGVSHLLEHLDVIQVLPNPTAQDLLLGYPTAGLLIVIGLIMLPAEKF